MPAEKTYTYRPSTTAQGSFEAFDPSGTRVTTGTLDAIKNQYPTAVADPFGQITQANTAKKTATTTAATTGAQSPTYTPYVSDSSTVVTGENKTISDLQSLLGQTPDVKSLLDNSSNGIADINKYLSDLETRRANEVAGIQKSYEQTKVATEQAQKSEAGSTNVALTSRLGGYLGGSASHVGTLNNLAATHRAELAKLDAQRDSAIQAANNAITDKEFAVARMKVDEVRQITNDIYQRQQDFFNNAVKLQQEARASRESLASFNKDYLDILSKSAGSDKEVQLDPRRAAEIDAFYGVPGFTQNYLSAARQAAVSKTTKDRIDSMKSYMDLLESIPAGMKVPFGDETITGIGKTADIATYQVEDASGNVRIVAYDKRTGGMSVTSAGAIGTPSSGTNIPEPTKQQALSAMVQFMETGTDTTGAPLRTAGGTYSATGYLEARKKMEKIVPGIGGYLDSIFLDPTKDYGQRYFDEQDLLYLRQKAGLGAGFGAIADPNATGK